MKPIRVVRCLVPTLLFPQWAAAATEVSIETAQVHEYCLPANSGSVLKYKFQSDQLLRFNVHYHEGQAVTYPVPTRATKQDTGELIIGKTREYCLMWRNATPARATLSFEAVLVH